MQYRLQTTREATEDVAGMAEYIVEKFKNLDAALSFLDKYDTEVQRLKNFPLGYEIRIKSFDTYNVFFIVDIEGHCVYILRVLKDRQDWKSIMANPLEYHFG